MNPTSQRAIALAGVLAELGVTSLSVERAGQMSTLAARTTDLPGVLGQGPCVLRASAPVLTVNWRPAGACRVEAPNPAVKAAIEAALTHGSG